MKDRGYPTGPYDQTVADLSVEHASTLDHFRAAHDISRNAASASTEDLRQAMIHYRALFAELLGEPAARPEAGTAGGHVTTTQPDGLPAVDQPATPVDQPAAPVERPAAVADEPAAAAGPDAAGETVDQPVGGPARTPTADAVTTARRQER